MKKIFITYGLLFIIFLISVSSLIAQDNLTLYQTRLCIMFKPGVISLPQGASQALIQDIPNLPNWLSSLSSAGLQEIAKAKPNFNPADSMKILPDGRKIKKLNYNNIYRLILNIGSNLDSVLTYLKTRPEVAFVERWPIIELAVTPNDDSFPKQWALNNDGGQGGTRGADIGALGAWNYTTGSSSIKIGIIDCGVSGAHEDLAEKVENPGFYGDIHGMQVAGVAAAIGNNGKGIAGVDWNAKVYSKILCGKFDPAGIRDSIQDAVDAGCQVLNNSWLDTAFHTEIRSAFAYAYNHNVVSAAAMGNNGGIGPIFYPAGFKQGVIAVGATDDNDDRANYSGMGNHIDVVAPGGTGGGGALPEELILTLRFPPNGYGRAAAGTSLATPHVSGLASLLLAYNPGLANDDIQNIIQLSAKDVNFITDPGWDSLVGWGRINAKAAFDSLQIPNTLEQFTKVDNLYGSVRVESIDSFGYTPVQFYGVGDLADGQEYVQVIRYKLVVDVTFPVPYYVTPHVWGVGYQTTGFSTELPNFGLRYCKVDSSTIRTTGCQLETYVYQVPGFGFVPSDPTTQSATLTFGYTVLGERTLSAPSGFSVVVRSGPPNQISLGWRECNVNEESLFVRRKTPDEPGFSVIARLGPLNNCSGYIPPTPTGIGTATFLDSDIIGSETYTYKVYAWTRHQTVQTDTIRVTNVPREPQNLTATVVTDPSCGGGLGMESFGTIETEAAAPPPNCNTNLVNLSWQPPSAQKAGTIAEYIIHARSTNPLSPHEKWLTVPGTVTEATICLKVDKTYDFWVHTIDTYGAQSLASNKVTKTTGHSGAIACVDDPPVTGAPIPDADPNDKTQGIPKEFSLSQNYPNPFNLSTQIRYSLPQDAQVRLVIYNILGQKIKEFDLGNQTAGYKSITWDGKNEKGDDVPSGLYLYRIKAGSFIQANKMTLLK